MNYKLPAVIIILILVIVSGTFVFSGFFIRDSRAVSILESTNKWLLTEEGKTNFPDTVALEPYKVLDSAEKEVVVWLVPLKKGDIFVGYIETAETTFERPSVYTKFAQPQKSIFKKTADDALAIMYKYTNYSASQISKPILIVHRQSIMWHSDAHSGMEQIDSLDVPAFWPFDDLFNNDGKIKTNNNEQANQTVQTL